MIGILAGMGPHSTAPFIDLVIAECQRQYGAKDDIDFPKIMIHSVPTPFYADQPTDHPAMEAAIGEGLQELDKTSVRFIAIACNTAHVYYPKLAKCIKKPLLNMVQLTVDLVPAPTKKLAVIAARPTSDSGIYQLRLREQGFEVVEPEWQEKIDQLIMSVRSPQEISFFIKQWAELVMLAEAMGVDTLILACLDLSAIRQHLKTNMMVIDASEALAQNIVSRWLQDQQKI